MCALLSCHLKRLCFRCSIRHRRSSPSLRQHAILCAKPRSRGSGVEFRCAVQSSALCDGVAALLICSTGTVVAHFSIALTEQRHRQSSAVRPSSDRRSRRRDNVRFVVVGLHRSSSAGADLLCQMAPVSVPAPCVSTVGLLLIDALRAACGPCHGHAGRHPPGSPPDRRHRTCRRSTWRA